MHAFAHQTVAGPRKDRDDSIVQRTMRRLSDVVNVIRKRMWLERSTTPIRTQKSFIGRKKLLIKSDGLSLVKHFNYFSDIKNTVLSILNVLISVLSSQLSNLTKKNKRKLFVFITKA